MRPLWLVEDFYKLSRAFEFNSFGFLNLEFFNFKDDASMDFSRETKLNRKRPKAYNHHHIQSVTHNFKPS